MNYSHYQTVVIITAAFWGCAIVTAYFPRQRQLGLLSNLMVLAGILVLSAFTAALWMNLGRPPLRTLGETRLWYAILLSLAGYALQRWWKMPWLQTYSLFMAVLFLLLNLAKPEVFDRTLMPALQSPWFVPHVVVYLEAYALLAAASLIGLKGLLMLRKREDVYEILLVGDSVVYAGYAFLTLGLLFGGLWAKTAWGHYWSWDPKETWALLTWLAYLAFIHIRSAQPDAKALPFWLLLINFAVLLLCWFGINYLPATQYSVHAYS